MKIPSTTKAVIFDMDGLLIDSEPYWQKTTEAFFAKHNKPFSPEIHRHTMGRGLRDIIEYFKSEWGFVGNTDALIAERKELLYSYLLQDLSLMEGADTLIRSLHARNIPLAIATSGHSRERTKQILDVFDLTDLFQVLVSGDDIIHAKPAPDIYLKTATMLDVRPETCLVFEDAPNGVLAGKSAGMMVIGVNSDASLQKKLHDAKADAIVSSLVDIVV